MNHTILGLLPAAATILTVLLPGQGKSTRDESQDQKVKELTTRLMKTEKDLGSVEIELTTADEFPNGVRFRTKARLRVHQKTHYHVWVEANFGDDFRSEKETVVTPDGCFRHQRDPREDIYLRMKASLMDELRQKTSALEKDENAKRLALPGPGTSGGGAPLGSAMLQALNHAFALKMTKEEKTVDGEPCVLIRGVSREPSGDQEKKAGSPPSRIPVKVEVLCRKKDGIPVRMTQFNREGQKLLQFAVQKLALNPKLDPASFKLAKPKDVPFIDFEKHPPSWAQIQRIREAYQAKVEADRKKGDKPVPAKKGG